MAPQFWTPTVESDADELVVGAATGSTDALGRHAYGIEAGWSTRARPDWQIAYAYDRWQPTIFGAYADDTDPWRSGEVRVRELEAGMLLRISRMRFSHATLAAVHAERASFDCPSCDEPIDVDRDLTSVRLGWEFTNARAFGYSISAEEGGRVSVTTETTREAFGADGNGFAMTAEGRRYWRLGPRHAVVAVRGAAARSWGDSDAERRFSAAGSGPLGSGLDFGTDAIGLLRGYEDGAFAGTRAFVVNADYRLPLRRIDRGLGTLPFFLRSVHAAVFVDSGNVWNSGSWADVRTTAGGEVSMDTVLGFVLPVTFTVGGAWRHGGPDGEQRFVAFGRIGRAF